jgi:crotonobetainyl-CoA:carnitine CoA-transferase CaiB-like acyl-CoA transferase
MLRRQSNAMQGLKVLEFSHVIAGPFAGLQMALLGAEVTKIEPPATGDFLRSLPHGRRAYETLNGTKQIRPIDLNTPHGLAEARALISAADVLIDSFAPGALARKGLDYSELQMSNPGLIYCSISGFGSEHAEWGQRRAYDHVVQAMTGMAWQTGREGDPPIKVGFPVVDTASGLVACNAVLAALLERQLDGRGQYLEVSMARAALQLLFPSASEVALTGVDARRVGNVGFSGSPGAQFFACCDGWLALGANTTAQIARAAAALGVEPAPVDHVCTSDITAAQIAEVLLSMSALDAEARLAGVQVPAARVRTLHEFLRDAQTSAWLPTPSAQPSDVARCLGTAWHAYDAAPSPVAQSAGHG